jgi:FixJ family two-component response regulator
MTQPITVIAVVDDDPAVRKALKRLLSSAGFAVNAYSSGADFVRAIDSHRHDCAVVDVQMDTTDGFSVLEQLQSRGGDVPVILITAYEAADDEQRALRGGAVGFLRKPFSGNELIDMIGAALRAA